MHVVMNRLTVPDEYLGTLQERFSGAGERMKGVPGCLEYMFLLPTEGNEVVVFMKWEDEKAYQDWVAGDAFTKAHANANPNSPVKGDLRQYTVKYTT